MTLMSRLALAAVSLAAARAVAEPPSLTPLSAPQVATVGDSPDALDVGVSSFLLPVPAAMRLASTFRDPGSIPVVPMVAAIYTHASTRHRSVEVRADTIGLASRVQVGLRWRFLARDIAPYFAARLGVSALLPPVSDTSVDVGATFSLALGVAARLGSRLDAGLELEVGGFAGVPVAGLTVVVGRRCRP